MYLAWATTLVPILINFSRSVVSVQPWVDFGRTTNCNPVADAIIKEDYREGWEVA
jgi:hypothetical protein